MIFRRKSITENIILSKSNHSSLNNKQRSKQSSRQVDDDFNDYDDYDFRSFVDRYAF